MAPCNKELGILNKSDTATLAAFIEARPLPGFTCTLPDGRAMVQNRPDAAMPGLKSCNWLLKLLKSGAPGPSYRSIHMKPKVLSWCRPSAPMYSPIMNRMSAS